MKNLNKMLKNIEAEFLNREISFEELEIKLQEFNNLFLANAIKNQEKRDPKIKVVLKNGFSLISTRNFKEFVEYSSGERLFYSNNKKEAYIIKPNSNKTIIIKIDSFFEENFKKYGLMFIAELPIIRQFVSCGKIQKI